MTSTTGIVRPLPQPDPVSAGFWEAAARDELVIQLCGDCGKYQHPPQGVCPFCGSVNVAFTRVSGKATLYSWSLMYHRVLPGLDDAVPYLCLLVELAEQKLLILASDLIYQEYDPADLRLGAPMEVWFMPTEDPAVKLPQFRFVKDAAR